MSLNTKHLSKYVGKIMMDRFELLIALRVTADIQLEFTRTELRRNTNTDSIKDVSITKMLTELRADGYEVRGTAGGEVFHVTFRVLDYLSRALSLSEMDEGSDYLEDIILRRTVVGAKV